jgi:hypothetical protein
VKRVLSEQWNGAEFLANHLQPKFFWYFSSKKSAVKSSFGTFLQRKVQVDSFLQRKVRIDFYSKYNFGTIILFNSKWSRNV